jgi:hypothetical protein
MQWTVIRSESFAFSMRSRARAAWLGHKVTVSTLQLNIFAAMIAKEPHPVP